MALHFGRAWHFVHPATYLRIMPPEAIAGLENIPHRRFVKTHLPVDALVFSARAKYIYVGRDGRDSIWSLHNHYTNMLPDFIGALNNMPGLVGDPLPPAPDDVHELYTTWFEGNGKPFWPFWENVSSWWNIRHLPNVKLVHFSDMKRDLPGSIRDIAAFLEIAIDERYFPAIIEHCTFDYMKAHAEQVTPLGGQPWRGGAKTFINQGSNERWRNVLSAQEVEAYEKRALAELGPECARWLANGAAATA